MQGHRIIAPIVLLTLLSIAGCKDQPAPVADQPAPAAANPVSPALTGDVHVRLKKGTDGWRTHHYAKYNETVVFKADTGFDLVFAKDHNPCVATQSGKEDVYTSSVPQGGKKHVVKCKILNPNKEDFAYEIRDNPYEKPTPYLHLNITPCWGCHLDTNDDDD